MAKAPAVPKIPPRWKRAPLTRSQMMARIRSKDTRPEVLTRSAVQALGVRFRNHVDDLPGKPDLANKTNKWAIFVHGCFWHSHQGCQLASSPKSNTDYWAPKLARNRTRDAEKMAALHARGFRTLVVWECTVRSGAPLRELLATFFTGDGRSSGDSVTNQSAAISQRVHPARRRSSHER
ncbi:MAG: DNA mismatch endonuclease Vsr [Bauldia sp.]|nr:DNA mismatch endonuclease Vsr [Bauldia sp.]